MAQPTGGKSMDQVQLWTLAGIVIGAILGGVAQVIADGLRARRERTSTTQAIRRQTYQEFLVAFQAAFHTRTGFLPDLLEESAPTTAAEMRTDRPLLEAHTARLLETAQALDTALSGVMLVGPPSVTEKAIELERHLNDFHETADDETMLFQHQDQFIAAAQPHAGIL